MDALVRENGSNMIVFKPKSPRRARGGWVSLIRIFDCRDRQQGVTISDYDSDDIRLECSRAPNSSDEETSNRLRHRSTKRR